MSTSRIPAPGWTQLALPLETARQTQLDDRLANDRLDWPHAAGVIGFLSAGLWLSIWQLGKLFF